jgi:hypothetical protein
MSWKIGKQEYDQTATVWSVESKGTYAIVALSTSRKDKKTEEYVNSNWKFCKFVGKAFEGIEDVPEKTRIIIKSGLIEHAPYMKDGEKVWAKNPSITIFAWEFAENAGEKTTATKSSKPAPKRTHQADEEIPEEEYPF